MDFACGQHVMPPSRQMKAMQKNASAAATPYLPAQKQHLTASVCYPAKRD